MKRAGMILSVISPIVLLSPLFMQSHTAVGSVRSLHGPILRADEPLTDGPVLPGWQIPFNVANGADASQDDYYDFGWQSFIALNWPSLTGERGAPDPAKTIGAIGPDGAPLPVVWESYKTPEEVFLPYAATPPPWNSPEIVPSSCKDIPPGAKMLAMLSKGTPAVLSGLHQAGFPLGDVDKTRGPLIDQSGNYVRYEVRLNRSEFTYITDYQYYNADIQTAATTSNPPTFQTPPKGPEDYVQSLPPYARQGAVELKASWRVLNPKKDIISRYYHQTAYLLNPDGKCGGPVTMGLVGLHILRLTPTTGATWFWATFEQEDNVQVDGTPPVCPNGKPLTPSFNPTGPPRPSQYPSGYSYEPKPIQPGQKLPRLKPVNVWRAFDIDPGVEAKNQEYQAQLKGTVWQYYKMVGTMNVFTQGTPGQKSVWVPTTNYPLNGQPQQPVYVNTPDMSNTTMETYLQANNCITCHGYAVPLGVTPSAFKNLSQYQIFTFALGLAQKPKQAAGRAQKPRQAAGQGQPGHRRPPV